MKLFWIAGEPSGDVQAAKVVQAIAERVPDAAQYGWGGPQMQQAGMTVLKDTVSAPFMGFVEVVRKASTIRAWFAQVKQEILDVNPDVLVLVDYPGFNLRIAKWAKGAGFKVAYYIPPKVWAWKSKRAAVLNATCDRILSILPFESEWYAARGMEVVYVGNPLAHSYAGRSAYAAESKTIALLPGSRKQEIGRLMPEFLKVAAAMPEWKFRVVRGANAVPLFEEVELPGNVDFFTGDLAEGLENVRAALTCSGTATLEVAVLGVPQLVVYKANPISLQIAKAFVKLDYFSLPNLVAQAPIVPELLQEEASARSLVRRLETLLGAPEVQLVGLEKLATLLREEDPSKRAADELIALVS
jgi:lipid-A-disaccharide synthase